MAGWPSRLRSRATGPYLSLRYREAARLHAKYRGYTMIPRAKFVDNLLLCERVFALPGDVVECGTWRGGMSAAMAELIDKHAAPPRRHLLFDSFEGLPEAKPIDGDSAIEWQANPDGATFFDNCTAAESEARAAMALSRVLEFDIEPGWFEDTVPRYAATAPAIALLRLDGDWYDSTMTCLESLMPLVVEGGVVIIDDYGTWDGCTRAVHDYLSRVQSSAALRRTRYGVAFLVQPAAQGTRDGR